LTKGPLALVLCGFAVVIYLMLSGRNPLRLLREAWLWQTLAVALAMAALWYVPAFLSAGSLLSVQFGQENLGHLLPAQLGGTGEAARPFYYIAARMVGTSLPLSLFIPALLFALADAPVWAAARKPILYQLSIVLAVLVVFSLATSKRDIYMLPALPSLAILLAGLFTVGPRLGAGYARRLWDAAGVVLAAAALAIVVGAVLVSHIGALPEAITSRLQSSDAAYAALFVDGITNWHWRFVVFICASGIAAIAISFALIRRRPTWAAVGVALMSIAGVSLWIGTLRPELARSRSLKDFAAKVQSIVGNGNVYVLGGMEYELSFYLGRGVPVWNPGKADAAPNPPYYLVASGEEFAKLAPDVRAGLSILARTQSPLRRSQMILLKVDKVPSPRAAPTRS
jgi:4-amino-4-deoxy-L-arabinose transferase-like glycosyltransferase